MKFNLNTEVINYIKINYADKDNFSHCIKAAIRLINDSEILASAKFDENMVIPTPQPVKIGLACNNGLYKVNTTLKRVEFDDPYILFSMNKPEEMEFTQNREYFRVRLQENVNICYQKNDELVRYAAISYDLSAKGIRIELDEAIEFPEETKVSIFFQNKIINASAKYVRTDIEENILTASFQFVDISQADLDFISQICFQKQLEERRKALM